MRQREVYVLVRGARVSGRSGSCSQRREKAICAEIRVGGVAVD